MEVAVVVLLEVGRGERVTWEGLSRDTEVSEKTETVRQKDYLEKTVLSLKSQLSQVDQQNKTNSAKMLKENKALLQEISRLKAELKDVKKFKAKLPLKRKASPTTE